MHPHSATAILALILIINGTKLIYKLNLVTLKVSFNTAEYQCSKTPRFQSLSKFQLKKF
jgi:hypothetical protein